MFIHSVILEIEIEIKILYAFLEYLTKLFAIGMKNYLNKIFLIEFFY